MTRVFVRIGILFVLIASGSLHAQTIDTTIRAIVAKSNATLVPTALTSHAGEEFWLDSCHQRFKDMIAIHDSLNELIDELWRGDQEGSRDLCIATSLLLRSRQRAVILADAYWKFKLSMLESLQKARAVVDSLMSVAHVADPETAIYLFSSYSESTSSGMATAYGGACAAAAVIPHELLVEDFYGQTFPLYYGAEEETAPAIELIVQSMQLFRMRMENEQDELTELTNQWSEVFRMLLDE